MSIIFDALKKAVKEENYVAAELTERMPRREVKNFRNTQLQRSKTSHLLVLVILLAILIGEFLSFGIFTKHDSPFEKLHESKIKISTSTATPETNLAAEGYLSLPQIPKEKSRPVTVSEPKTSNPTLSLNGIICGMGKPTAIIGNKIVEEGESLKGVKVVKIYNNRVELFNESSGKTFILQMQ